MLAACGSLGQRLHRQVHAVDEQRPPCYLAGTSFATRLGGGLEQPRSQCQRQCQRPRALTRAPLSIGSNCEQSLSGCASFARFARPETGAFHSRNSK
jgi:hypothetical protein